MTDVLTIDDLITDKKHSTFFAEVVTGKTGGLSTGDDIATSTNQVTGQVQKTLPRVLAELGMVVQTWTAASGGTLTNAAQVFLNDKVGSAGLGNYYAWSGAFPKVVTAGLDPAITAGFIMRSDAGLRSELAANTGANLVKTSTGQTVADRFIADETLIAAKANTADVNAALSAKANTADVTAALSAKADINRTKKGGLTQSILANVLTLNYAARLLQFRNSTLTNGTAVEVTPSAAMGLTIPSGATLGGASGIPLDIFVLGIYNGGFPVIGVVNANGGLVLDESGLISTTAISATSTSASTIYTTSVVTNSPYVILASLTVTLPTAGAWSVLPTVIPTDLVSVGLLMKRVLYPAVATRSGTSIGFQIPSWAKKITVQFNGVSTSGTSYMLLKMGVFGVAQASTYTSTYLVTGGTNSVSGGFFAGYRSAAANVNDGSFVLTRHSDLSWTCIGYSCYAASAGGSAGGSCTLTGVADSIFLTTVNGTDTFDAGSVSLLIEG